MPRTHAPAFQFYPIDFLNGSKLMTLSERGAYITLLCEQWDQEGVHQDIQALRKLFGCGPVEAERIWRSISYKFCEGVDGLWRNARLERERKKQAKFRRKQKRNGQLGGRPRKNPSLNSGLGLGKPKKSSSSSSSDVRTKNTYSDADAPPRSKKAPTPWKRAIAIAHVVFEAHSNASDRTDAFKTICGQQGISYGERGGKDQRPLYARVLDYVEEQRKRRAR